GRGLELHAPAVKVAARELGIPVTQPTKVRTPDFLAWVEEQRADVAVVIAYGRILTPAVLAAPKHGCMNLHASILPRYRGAAPINWCIVRGEKETGISLMQMDEGMDTGPVFTVRRIAIGENETAGELAGRLAELGAEVVRQDIPRAVRGELQAAPQDHAAATAAPPLEKQQGRIDWTRPAAEVHDHVRGMTPWPSAFTTSGGKMLKVLATKRSNLGANEAPGTIVAADTSGVLVACGQGVLEITRAQVEGKKALDARDLVSGRTLVRGARLG
ncbi:MAG: methionyl-tRNA formyltransferase, partial [Polyangiaceae bacterium]